jgi:hypothetical protein
MIFPLFWLLIAELCPLAQSSSPIFFEEEQEKIISKYISLNRIHSANTYFGDLKDIKVGLPVELLMDFDPIKFLQKMQKNGKNYSFMIAFWYSFNGTMFFICSPWSLIDSEKFIRKIIESYCGFRITSDIIYHFKVYLMRKLFFYSKPDDRQKFLSEAIHFFNANLKNLLRKLKKDWEGIVKAMPRNFRFYQRCIGEETPRSILLSEFSKLKASKGSAKFEIHLENISFLLGALNNDKSSHFGLGLIADQTPTNIGHFLLLLVFQEDILKGEALAILERKLSDSSLDMLDILYNKFPIFKVPKKINSFTEFKLKDEFIDTLNEMKEKDEIANQAYIIQLTRSIFNTIIHF